MVERRVHHIGCPNCFQRTGCGGFVVGHLEMQQAGNATAAIMRRMAITIVSSIKEKPRCRFIVIAAILWKRLSYVLRQTACQKSACRLAKEPQLAISVLPAHLLYLQCVKKGSECQPLQPNCLSLGRKLGPSPFCVTHDDISCFANGFLSL